MTDSLLSKSVPAIKPELALVIDDIPIRRFGYLTLLVSISVFGLWSYLAPIDSAVLAPGTVTVKDHRKTVQHLDGGIISKLLVKDGDRVTAGADLIKLDDTQIKAQYELLRGQWVAQKTLNERLNAERDRKKDLHFSEELNQAALTDPRVKEAIQVQKQNFLSRKNNHDGEIKVLQQRIQQLDSKVVGLNAQKLSKQQLETSYRTEIKDLKEMLAEGFVDKQRLRDLERNHTLVMGEIATLSSDIASTQMQKGETELEILQIEQKFQADVADQQEEATAQLFDINEKLLAIADKQAQTVIKAPIEGVVFNLSIYTEGGVIAAGKPILDIVPEHEDLIISAQVSALDVDSVRIGAVAEVKFTAFNTKTTPSLEGTVSNLSADSFTNENTGAHYYLANVELTKASEQKLGELKIISGMPAEVFINTGERTLFEYLMQPISDAFARAFIEE